MITARIIGGDTFAAGELIRLLINHPDIESLHVEAPGLAGRHITAVHYGLDGETDLRFADSAPDEEPGVTFDCTNPLAIAVVKHLATDEHVEVTALPELYRKALVRGARKARVPHPAIMAISLALLPMAKNLLLSGIVRVDMTLPEQFNTATDATPADVSQILRELQHNFSAPIEFKTGRAAHPRVLTARVTVDTNVDLMHILELYHDFYDDHGLTRFIGHAPTPHDVANTGKSLIYLSKQGDALQIDVAFDALVKGTAGTAVHAMNLLFGLDERVALNLKASGY